MFCRRVIPVSYNYPAGDYCQLCNHLRSERIGVDSFDSLDDNIDVNNNVLKICILSNIPLR